MDFTSTYDFTGDAGDADYRDVDALFENAAEEDMRADCYNALFAIAEMARSEVADYASERIEILDAAYGI